MTPCVVCQHAKTQAITESLTSGLLLAVVAIQYRVKKSDLLHHLQHAPLQAAAAMDSSSTANGGDSYHGTSLHDAPIQALPTHHPTADGYPPYAASEFPDTDEPLVDPLRRCRYYLEEAASAWREVDTGRRTYDRLQLILEEVFASEDMGL